ncbi:GNAT family N-acetyltransferase [Dactylosporangium sp. CA-233914]|uniref:GNAT family N-acetyltransferase n=1 Tax=Dactylosporangium sp. CA-233914 TaxID=3239934 RepID=UPI003D942C87
MNPVALPGGVVLRPIAADDAPALLTASLRNRHRLRRSSPMQPEWYWTLPGQRERVAKAVERNTAGEALTMVLTHADAIVGMITLSNIVHGPFCNASVGYWIDTDYEGRGLTSAALTAVCEIAEAELGLHRIEASTLPDNEASQRVLRKNGFERIGQARDYLYLDGTWQESVLFQRILHDRPPPAGSA